jgi:sentrin-specific protease 7
MADSNTQILRQLGYNWLECQDEQGVFYWNEVTQQSSDTVPPELLGGKGPAPGPVNCAAPMAAPVHMAAAHQHQGMAKIIAGGIPQMGHATPPSSYIPHVQAQQQMYAAQPQTRPAHQQQVPGMHYQQPHVVHHSHQPHPVVSSYTPMPQQVQAQPQVQYVQHQVQQPQVQQQQPQVQQQPPHTAPAVQKMAFGDWAVYQDELGTFYMHVPTGQQFERPPPELMQAYQQYRAEQDQLHMQQLQQIELQRQQIDQQMMQQTEALRLQYGIPNGVGA